MFNQVYELYAKSAVLRWTYQLGFLIAWAMWASSGLQTNEATWLVFGWLPAIFWPVQLVARVLSWLGT